jgi:hypothetical protein
VVLSVLSALVVFLNFELHALPTPNFLKILIFALLIFNRIMASYIFGENKLEHPFFVKIDTRKNYLLLAEGMTKDNKTGKWTVRLLQELTYHPFLQKCLNEGIRITLTNHQIVYVRKRGFLFFKQLSVFIDKDVIKGRHFSTNKITY